MSEQPEEGDPASTEDVDAVIRRWVRNQGDLSTADFTAIRRWLLMLVGRRLPIAGADASTDIVDALLTRTVLAIREKRVAERTAPAYVAASARRASIDWLRQHHQAATLTERLARERGIDQSPPADEDVVRMLDSRATVALVQRALRDCLIDNDMTTARIITAWLDLAAARGSAPSTRQVADKAHVSHTTVATALRSFGHRLRRMSGQS